MERYLVEDYVKKAMLLAEQVVQLANKESKLSGFTIGNTAKVDENGIYFTPLRNSTLMVTAGAIVYSEQQAIDIANVIDGKVDYVLVDVEKKTVESMSLSGEPANVERAVRETVIESNLWVYKANDLSVEAIDGFISQLTKDDLKGVGSKKIAIIGAGNIGSKLALKLVERGANVYISRRDKEKLTVITEALNYIKPEYTTAKIVASPDNDSAAHNADIIIGVSPGIPVITPEMIKNLADDAIIFDVGKGTVHGSAMAIAEKLNVNIYRLDISSAFEGLITKLYSIENTFKNKLGRIEIESETLVSGGLLGRYGEIVVDNIHDIKMVYGIADGKGDFIRQPSVEQKKKIEKINKLIAVNSTGVADV